MVSFDKELDKIAGKLKEAFGARTVVVADSLDEAVTYLRERPGVFGATSASAHDKKPGLDSAIFGEKTYLAGHDATGTILVVKGKFKPEDFNTHKDADARSVHVSTDGDVDPATIKSANEAITNGRAIPVKKALLENQLDAVQSPIRN